MLKIVDRPTSFGLGMMAGITACFIIFLAFSHEDAHAFPDLPTESSDPQPAPRPIVKDVMPPACTEQPHRYEVRKSAGEVSLTVVCGVVRVTQTTDSSVLGWNISPTSH